MEPANAHLPRIAKANLSSTPRILAGLSGSRFPRQHGVRHAAFSGVPLFRNERKMFRTALNGLER